MRRVGFSMAVAMALAVVLPALQAGAEEAEAFRYGVDFRLRQEYLDDIPIIADPPGITRGGENNYFRFRTRVWGEFDPFANVTLKARVVNEFREWEDPDVTGRPDRSTYEFPDEFVFDNLFIDVRNLAGDRLDLRLGRQDLIYGTGKVILEGTPKDGSRTIYFNAAKAVWKGIPNTTIDIVGLYNDPTDKLAINSVDRDLTGYTAANDGATESGAFIYLKNKSHAAMPFELYGIYKNESEWEQAARRGEDGALLPPGRAWQELDQEAGVIRNQELDLGTAGLRLMPQFSDRLSANLEFAYQAGERGDVDVRGYMADAFIIYKAPFLAEMQPVIDYGLYYLSGDDPETEKDEGWNPLWARYPQYSELYVYAFDAEAAGRWSNVAMPHVGLTLAPAKWLKTSARLAYLFAPESDGPGGGDERGFLAALKGEFTVGENLLVRRDRLMGHLWLELLEPGNYYNVDDTALFARWELVYTF